MSDEYFLMYMYHTGEVEALKLLLKIMEPLRRMFVAEILRGKQMQILTHDDLASICNKHLVDAIYLYRDDQKASFPTFYVMYSKNRLRSILKKEYNVRSCSNTNTLSLDYEFEDGSTMYDMMPQSNVLYDPQYYTRYNMLLERVSDIVGNLNPEEITYLNQWIDGIKYRDGADRMQVPLRHYEHKMVKLKRRIHESIERD